MPNNPLSLSATPERLAWVEEQLGQQVPQDVLRARYLGHRLAIAVAPADERTDGGLYIPDSIREAERGGEGYILVLGDAAGLGTLTGGFDNNYDPWIGRGVDLSSESAVLSAQREFLGRHIGYGKYAVKAVRLRTRDRDLMSDFAIISAKDVWFFHNDEAGFTPAQEGDSSE